jgi:hypothetical protein
LYGQWQTGIATVKWPDGEEERILFYWREPMDFIRGLIADESLMKHSHFYATQKFLRRGSSEVRMVDEPWTGNTWYTIEVSNPSRL